VSQRVFVVVGAKGGVGATTIAINLVQRFPAAGERVIVDADLTGKRSLAVWYDLADALDVARVIGTASIARVKAGPLVMEFARTYEDGLIETSASVARAIATLPPDALIIVDAPQPFAATVRPFISRASKIIVVTEPTLMGVSVAHASLAAMERFGILPSRIALVVSDLSGKGEIVRADIERALKLPVSAELLNTRDRRFQGRFDGLLTTLASAPAHVRDPGRPAEQPMFDRRSESGEASA